MENFHPKLHTTVWSGFTGKDMTTLRRELKWSLGRKSSRKAFFTKLIYVAWIHSHERCWGHTKVFRKKIPLLSYIYWFDCILFCIYIFIWLWSGTPVYYHHFWTRKMWSRVGQRIIELFKPLFQNLRSQLKFWPQLFKRWITLSIG